MIMYSIKDGFKVNKRFAQPAGEIMAQLESEDRLTAKELVDVSRPEDAPLHDYFEWNDDIAAEKYRESQGGYLIRATVEVEEKRDIGGSNEVHVEVTKPFYAIEDGSEKYYHIETIVQSEDKCQKLYTMALRELRQFERRYEIIREKLSPVFDAIDSLNA